MSRVDREVDSLMTDTSGMIGENVAPTVNTATAPRPDQWSRDVYAERPGTVNPSAEELAFVSSAMKDAQDVIDRLEGYAEIPADAISLDMASALEYALVNSREYRFDEEEYVLTAMRLLIERHQWGPRFFDEVGATIVGDGNDGLYDTSARLVNEFRITQRLPYGGEVSARALARATEDLHQRVSGERIQTADIIISANIPLLRGAGMVAREDIIQAERDLIYAARTFERSRREFMFSIASDFLDLIVRQQNIENARLGVESFEQLQKQQEALYTAGRATPFDAAEALNNTLDSIDRLNSSRENYRVSLDNFKVRIGMPIDQALIIEPDSLGTPTPDTQMEDAIFAAMMYRLDLQSRRDQLDDSVRSVAIARNNLLGDLDLTASWSLPTDPARGRAGLDFESDESDFQVGITYGLPLDREIERLGLRQSEIRLARAQREFERFRDTVAVNVRSAVRGIDRALFSLQIQERNVEIADLREASIAADPARANIRQRTDAINQTFRARDARDSALRDLEVAVLGYLLATGQLRVDDEGYILPLSGMELESGGGVEEAVAPSEG